MFSGLFGVGFDAATTSNLLSIDKLTPPKFPPPLNGWVSNSPRSNSSSADFLFDQTNSSTLLVMTSPLNLSFRALVKNRMLPSGDRAGRYSSSVWLVYASGSGLYALRFE